jgi:hypothetical protein
LFIFCAKQRYHGSYESLNGGCIGEALVDLTGGSVEIIDLNSAAAKALADGPGGKLWSLLTASIDDKYTLVCASVPTSEEDKREVEKIPPPPEPSSAVVPKSPSSTVRGGGARNFQRQMSAGNLTANTANSLSSSSMINNGVLSSSSSSNVMTPAGPTTSTADKAAAQAAVLIPGTSGIDAGACLSVRCAKRFGAYDLVQLNNPLPGGGFSWSGDWGRRSNKWTENTDVSI